MPTAHVDKQVRLDWRNRFHLRHPACADWNTSTPCRRKIDKQVRPARRKRQQVQSAFPCTAQAHEQRRRRNYFQDQRHRVDQRYPPKGGACLPGSKASQRGANRTRAPHPARGWDSFPSESVCWRASCGSWRDTDWDSPSRAHVSFQSHSRLEGEGFCGFSRSLRRENAANPTGESWGCRPCL